jgi:ATP-dependent helicase/nuclease subunit A
VTDHPHRTYTLDWTKEQQARASDPEASAWVSANAGSGKTHVLSQRVIRLLLRGVRPAAILCLTYTKAAASEMSNRVFTRLAAWTRLDDAALSAAIAEIEGAVPSPARLMTARRLFALALETPGGLKIQTIHAFCEAVLHQFPLEANVAGHFSVLDDGETATLLAEARRLLLTAASGEDDAALSEAFATVLQLGGEQGLEQLLDDLVGRRAAIAAFVRDAARYGGVGAVLHKAAGIDPDETEDTVKAGVWLLASMPSSIIAAYGEAARSAGADTPTKWATALAAAGIADVPERWRILSTLFLTQAGKPASLKNPASKKIVEQIPDIGERLQQAQDQFLAVVDKLATLRMLRSTFAALTLGERLNTDYEHLKRQRGRLDFDDLVERTASLLTRQGASAWVHFKLDQGIDHILVDEAQDTSPSQWDIIRRLSDEFFAGESERRTRTLFAVGDEKQSIYSFQGAMPERFASERRDVETRALQTSRPFQPVELKLSFRSTEDVLGAVDAVFSHADHHRGLGTQANSVAHASVRGREPGQVDIWEMIGRVARDDEDDWTAPFDEVPESDPKVQLARRVAATIRDWIAREKRVEKGRAVPVRAGDILVLVRKRDAFVASLMRELKQAPAVPVAGADRLRLTDHIAVKDLMALGRAMALPDDDLSLAAVMKSPLFGLGEEAVFTLCADRPTDLSVRDHLRVLAADGQAPFVEASLRLEALQDRAARLKVHDFYAELLGPGGGRAAFLARLGSEVIDILDEFLAFALDHEASGLPGMQSFLAVLEAQSPEIKREMEQGRNEVRIMTVHASKGLEAPVVFLVDSGGEAMRAQHVPRLRKLDVSRRVGPMAPAVLWVASSEHENSLSESLKDDLRRAGEEEYRRLFYVGLTRAADRLVICGYHGLKAPTHPHWQAMATQALGAGDPARAKAMMFTAGPLDAAGMPAMTWNGLRFSRGLDASDFPPLTPDTADVLPALQLPATALPPPARPPRPLVPSGTGTVIDGRDEGMPCPSLLAKGARVPHRDGQENVSAGAAVGAQAIERGRAVHRLLQLLPDVPAGERRAAMARYLSRAMPRATQAEREHLADTVAAVLDGAQFGPAFAPGSRAEVDIMGRIHVAGTPHVVSGRIDRLAVDGESVLIVDYKTNRAPARSLEMVPLAHRQQMAIYKAVLQPLYPGHVVEAALLYTEAPALIRLDAATLDAALASIGRK